MRIETKRLIIRNFTLEDEADLCEYMLQRVMPSLRHIHGFVRKKAGSRLNSEVKAMSSMQSS